MRLWQAPRPADFANDTLIGACQCEPRESLQQKSHYTHARALPPHCQPTPLCSTLSPRRCPPVSLCFPPFPLTHAPSHSPGHRIQTHAHRRRVRRARARAAPRKGGARESKRTEKCALAQGLPDRTSNCLGVWLSFTSHQVVYHAVGTEYRVDRGLLQCGGCWV